MGSFLVCFSDGRKYLSVAMCVGFAYVASSFLVSDEISDGLVCGRGQI